MKKERDTDFFFPVWEPNIIANVRLINSSVLPLECKTAFLSIQVFQLI